MTFRILNIGLEEVAQWQSAHCISMRTPVHNPDSHGKATCESVSVTLELGRTGLVRQEDPRGWLFGRLAKSVNSGSVRDLVLRRKVKGNGGRILCQPVASTHKHVHTHKWYVYAHRK